MYMKDLVQNEGIVMKNYKIVYCFQRYDHEEELGTPSRLVEWIGAIMAGEQNFSPCVSKAKHYLQHLLQEVLSSVLLLFINSPLVKSQYQA